MTKISILTPCYNHSGYINQFIQSLLNQSINDFECIIVDDCSCDDTVEQIEKFNDDKIKLIKHDFNRGINAALNTAFKASSGEIVVFAASDDVLKPEFVENIIEIFNEKPNVDVVYASLDLIDEKDNTLNKVANIITKDKYELLNILFFIHNPLLSPGMAIKREAFEKLYPLDCSIVNQQDVKMHVQLLKENEIYINPKSYFYYRVPNENSGISNRCVATINREIQEIGFVLDDYLSMDIDTLKNIFKNELKDMPEMTTETIPYIVGLLALKASQYMRKSWGYRTVINFLKSNENFETVHRLYGFTYKELLNLINSFDESEEFVLERKVKKYKKLFNSTLLISSIVIVSLLIIMFFL